MSVFSRSFTTTLRTIAGDRAAVMTLIAAVVLYSFYYPAAYKHEVATRLPTVVVDLDRSPMSRALLRKVHAVRAIDLIEPVHSMEDARRVVASGAADGILVIDTGFQRDILRGGRGRLTLMGAGAFLGRSGTILQGLAEAVAGFSQEAGLAQARFEGAPVAMPFTLVQRPMFNTREGYASAVVPGVAVLIVQQTLIIGMALLAGTRRETHGRLRFPGAALGGVLAVFWIIGMLSLLYYTGFVFWFHDFPRGGNLAGLLLGGSLFIGAVVALGAFLGSFFRVRERAMQIILLTSMPLYFLSGLSWPATSMPTWIAWLARLVPTTPGIDAMIKFNQIGARVSEALPEMLNLVVLIALYGLLTLWRYRPASAAARASI